MSKWTNVKSVTLSLITYLDIKSRKTNNPIGEAELEEMLRDALKHGVQVTLTDPGGKYESHLILKTSGELVMVAGTDPDSVR